MGSFASGWTDGQVPDATDLNTIAGAWDSFTVTLTNVTLGNGTAVGYWKKIGRVVHYRAEVTFGSTTSVSGGITMNLPATGAAATGVHTGLIFDTSTTTYYSATIISSTTAVALRVINAAGTYGVATATSSTVPMTWATGDVFRLSGSYESAA